MVPGDRGSPGSLERRASLGGARSLLTGSLANPTKVEGILDAAGFTDVNFTDVHQPIYYGRDVAAALKWVRGFTCTKEVLARLGTAPKERALGRLREKLAAHASRDGVWFDSRAWIVKARRR
jgi:hypothetical protein